MYTRINNFIAKKPKTLIALLSAAIVAAVSIGVYAGFGPSRPTYDWNKYNSAVSCSDPSNAFGRCGSMNGPVFNSFINTPTYGDEEKFTRIAPVVAGQSPADASYSGTAIATPGNQYWVRTFVHNNANQNLNCLPANDNHVTNDCNQIDIGSPSIATNTRVRLSIPTGTANGFDVMTYVSADNATPGTIWDSSTLTNNNQAFNVSYVPGSAVIFNSAHPGGTAVSDAINSPSGAKIGYNQMDGILPGCFHYSAYVYVKVNVTAPALKVTKMVRASVNDSWSKHVSSTTGSTVEWKITYQNTGTAVDKNITIRDVLPQGLTIVPGSIKWYDAVNHGAVQPDTALDSGGVNLGNYSPVSNDINGEIVFDTKISSHPPACQMNNVGYGRATNVPEVSDNAGLTVTDCNVPPTPSYTCDELAVTLDSNKTVTIIRFATTASNGASFNHTVIDWGDESQNLTTNNVVGSTHKYAGNGPYTITAVATFDVNGQSVTPTTNNCVSVVNFSDKPVTPTTPGVPGGPTTLVNTGPGNIIGIFVGTSLLAAFFHRYFMRKQNI